jgi:hypothetical protein
MTFKFVGGVNCDKCKFFRVCKAGESNCPYMAGWKDGQVKILSHLREWQGHPIDFKDKLTQMLLQAEDSYAKR